MTTTNIALALAYVPIPDEIASEARRTLQDRFGHQLAVARNQGPCRSCLRISKAPEDLILLSYQPLPDTNPYAEIGPIFIHAHECTPYDSPDFPADFIERELVVRFSDLDANGHANSACYIEWLLEPLPASLRRERTLSSLDIVFQNEALVGEHLISAAGPSTNSSTGTRFGHALRSSEGQPVAIGRTEWT